MGRTPCCEKIGLKKGPWTPEEDQKLLAYIEQHGHGSWRALPGKAGLQRCGKSCRLRWTNYLRPDIKRGKFSLQEEQTIIQLHALLGNRWSAIATHLPKRTDNEIKNYWNTHLKKRLDKMGIDPVTHKPKNEALLSSDGPSKNAANLSHMAQWESARLEAEARLARQSKIRASSLAGSTTPVPDFSPAPGRQAAAAVMQPPPCLDILKAWSGTWTKPSEPETGSGGIWTKPPEPGTGSGGSGGDLESPTSTLSFSDTVTAAAAAGAGILENPAAFIEFVGNSGSLLKSEGEEAWKDIENPTDMPVFSFIESANGDNFMTRFTDLLLNNSAEAVADSRSFSGESESGRLSGSDFYEDNKNYWNSILNLVNSSPTDSPVF